MNVSIIRDNTQCRILNLAPRTFQILREDVLYFNMAAYIRASKWVQRNRLNSFKIYLIDENGFFPTGILLRVEQHLQKLGIVPTILDNRIVPKFKNLKLYTKIPEPTAYHDQTLCTGVMLNNERGVASIPTGVGKTRILKDYIQHLGARSVVITPSSALKEQTAEYLEDCFGSENVGMYDKRFDSKPITVINYHSLPSTDPRQWVDYHSAWFDEWHHATNETIRDVNQSHLNQFYFIHAATATNFASGDAENILLESVLSQELFHLSIVEAIEKKYIVPICAIFFDLQNSGKHSKEDYRKDFKPFVDLNDERNKIIVQTIQKLIKTSTPTLALVKHIDHGKHLQSLVDGSAFINGQDNNAKHNQKIIKAFNNLQLSPIFGTSVIGEGVDTKACGAVFNCKAGKSKKEILQNAGRAVRNFEGKNVGYYFDFIDRGQKHLIKQSRERMRIIERAFGIKAQIIKV